MVWWTLPFKAVEAVVPTVSELLLYSVNNITSGTDAQGEVSVRLRQNGRVVNGQGSDTDIVAASVKAYINALNKLQEESSATVSSSRRHRVIEDIAVERAQQQQYLDGLQFVRWVRRDHRGPSNPGRTAGLDLPSTEKESVRARCGSRSL